jgi:hypothetical protein
MKLALLSDPEILAIVNPMMDNLMAGSTAIDHAQHTRDFSGRMKAIVTPEHLTYMCKDYQSKWGFFGHREFVAIFRRPDSVAVIWKQFCTQQTGEFVAEIVVIEHDGHYLIDHAMVF